MAKKRQLDRLLSLQTETNQTIDSLDDLICYLKKLRVDLKSMTNHLKSVAKSPFLEVTDELAKRKGKKPIHVSLQLMMRSISAIKMSTRLRNCLKSIGFEYFGDALLMNPDQYLRYRNFGKKTLDELRKILNANGLDFNTWIDLESLNEFENTKKAVKLDKE